MFRYGEFIENIVMTLLAVFLGGLTIFFIVAMFTGFPSDDLPATNAQPIAQQQIGDEAEPDILIIYEAKVDGETVYPSVIKEAE